VAKHDNDAGVDTIPVMTCGATAKANGQACDCAADCASGFCVDGLCCNTACTETCKACNGLNAPGTCAFVVMGAPPLTADQCPKADPSTCGLDGTCDGAGACHRYAAGLKCRAGACDGASVGGGGVCDGAGRCKAGPATLCAPYDCDPSASACFAQCRADGDCADGVKCVAGSCGPKARGAVCAADQDCGSGFCSDGVCCNVACDGACVSCNQAGKEGTCWPVDAHVADPHGVCSDQGAGSCGQTGACDGLGGCALYPAETVCAPSACAGPRLNTAATCDGKGTCRAPGVQNCWPYNCTNGACATSCVADADCQGGHACLAGSCGPKPLGQTCAGAAECGSGFCVDGVCCDGACADGCTSCALPSSKGHCMPAPAGAADPHGACLDAGAAVCATNGLCDGVGGCARYKPGTVCAPERCEANVYTPAAVCDGGGQCVTPASLPCAPYGCNGARCFSSCRTSDDCLSPNTCVAASCGTKPIGAFCSAGTECTSGFCAQGVCCATACAGTCRSCALAGTMGQCGDVPTGAPDPSGKCVAQGTTTCGTNGMCEAGDCQKYPQGTPCGGASCPATGTTYTPGSTCDGAGACVTPAAISCAPYRCGGTACKATCTSDGDCVSPSICNAGSCGLKAPGAPCGDGTECASGTCAQGVCCRTPCAGTCMSCALPATPGTCAPVAAGGGDPTGTCKNAGAASCGTTGACDGAGACQLFAAGTTCAPGACPASSTTATLARTCDGAGTCRAASTLSCAPFACNGTACATTCTADAACASPNICDLTTNLCGNKKRLGQACATSDECLTGNFCVDGVCCGASACGTCQACNVAGSAGACAALPPGAADPHARCAPAPPCGFTGTCDGASHCQNAPTSTSCGQASCSGSTYTAAGFCNGAGTCAQASSSCSPYVCGNGACLAACAGDGDCVVGSACLAGACAGLHANGTACTSAPQCQSGHCVDGVCCGAASCPTCTSCAVPGWEGRCTAVPAGAPDPLGVCVVGPTATCGTNGTCDGAGACAFYGATTICSPATCHGNQNLAAPSTCNGAGTCVAGAMASCAPFACSAGACKKSCTSNGDCAPSHSCNVATGACQ
jgi:hypothetical protein